MTKQEMKISTDGEVSKKLHDLGARYGLSGNAVVAAAAYELSRVRPENLWHALGRIAAGEAQELTTNGRDPLPSGRARPRQAKAITDAVTV